VVDRDIAVTRPGFRLASGLPGVDGPPPVLGADTDAVLTELGLSAAAIATLREQGVV
jgi:crotonobetainyl-CoA:carnitine CoA-transferase CaiB-like acyl-CoA transferase